MTKLYAQEKRVFDINKVTVVGSPTITSDGVANGFGGSNYITVPLIDTTKPYKINIPIKTASINTEQYFFRSNYYLWCIVTANGKLSMKGATTSYGKDIFDFNTYLLSPNTEYLLSLEFTGSAYNIYINGELKYTKSETTALKLTSDFVLGQHVSSGASSFLGSIDLKQFSITVDNKLVYSPTKPICYLERRKEGFDLSKFTVVGSPTITEDGVASGFRAGNSVDIPITVTSNKFTIEGEFTFGSDLTTFQFACDVYSPDISRYIISVRPISDNYLAVCYWNGTGTEVVYYNQTEVPRIANKSYKYKIEIDGTTAKSTINSITKTTNKFVFSDVTKIILGNSYDINGAFKGSIDLPSISITVDGKEVFTGAKEKFYAMEGGF